MFIPRLIWKNKPQPITRKVITASVSGYASWAGTAYPYIGEYYHEFGIIGVIVFMYLLGRFSARLKELMYKKDLHSLVCYVSLYPLLFQVLIRGYTPSNFYMILMVFLPVLIEKSFASQRRKA
jgi:oligosaccharide repeat unit polymerase